MERYTRVKVIGKGAFGAAILVHARGDRRSQYVIKHVDVTRLDAKQRDEAKKEIKLLASFKHPNIVRYRDSFVEAGALHIVMDYAEGGDLHRLLKEQGSRLLAEETVLDYFVQLCLAMKHVHDRKVLHRDIKSQNVFLTQNRRVVKLGDFGIARVLNSTAELARTACGTPYYMSPEICDNKPYNDRSDVWSMGCLLYEMASLRCPFDARDMRGLVIKILRGAYPPLPKAFSPGLGQLVGRCLHRQPSQRPSVNELLALPVVRGRIDRFLSDAQRHTEFAHTMIHRNPAHNKQHAAFKDGGGGGGGGGADAAAAPPRRRGRSAAQGAVRGAAARGGRGGGGAAGGAGGGGAQLDADRERARAAEQERRRLEAEREAAAKRERERASRQEAERKRQERERVAAERARGGAEDARGTAARAPRRTAAVAGGQRGGECRQPRRAGGAAGGAAPLLARRWQSCSGSASCCSEARGAPTTARG